MLAIIMEILLELGEKRFALSLEEGLSPEGIKDKVKAELNKFGVRAEESFHLQKWSVKWNCYVSLDDGALCKLKDGDRVMISLTQESEVDLSFAI